MKKITVVGAGRVGESTAQFIASRDLCREIALIDIREGAAEGVAGTSRHTSHRKRTWAGKGGCESRQRAGATGAASC